MLRIFSARGSIGGLRKIFPQHLAAFSHNVTACVSSDVHRHTSCDREHEKYPLGVDLCGEREGEGKEGGKREKIYE